jgi:pyruvate dehydrogenase (quinone)
LQEIIVPPLPPHIGFDQALIFTRAIYRGDPDSLGIISRAFADMTENFTPHR